MRSESLLLDDPQILSWMRDNVIKDLITHSDRGNDRLQSTMSILNVPTMFDHPTVALFEPSLSLSANAEERDPAYELERIRVVLQSQLGHSVIIYQDGEERIGLLFPWKSLTIVQALHRTLNRAGSSPVSIGVGNPYVGLTEVRHSYEQAAIALKDKFYRGTGQLICYRELPAYEELEEYPLAKEKELLNRMKAIDSLHENEQEIEGFYRYLLRNGSISIKRILEMTIRLLAAMEKTTVSHSGDIRTSLKHEMMSIVKLETLQELIRFVARYWMDLKSWMDNDERESHRSVIKRTIVYMEQECHNASLDKMARKVYMTPTYLSMLFKVNTGKTFIDQLTDIRIDKAKEMLKNTCLRNYEVAEKVGYQDSRYFSQLFKKRVGLSPSEYREMGKG